MPNWNDVLKEIEDFKGQHSDDLEVANKAIDVVRRRYLERLFSHTNRNVIAYYSGILVSSFLFMAVSYLPILFR